MASPEDDPSKIPTREELQEELGYGRTNTDKYLVNAFKGARYKCYNNFLADTGISEKRLSEWSSKECQENLRKLARLFINGEGQRFWPDKPIRANKKGYTIHKHKVTYVSYPLCLLASFANSHQ